MASPKEFLAEEVLVEKKVITYRYLSRALKVHVNVAKRALFDFHAAQNAKKAGSLHATYLLYGTKSLDDASHAQNGGSGEGDVDMEDDLPDYLQSEKVPTTVITLVAEENVESALAQYETLDAVHVYSVSPQPMSDLQLLADTPRQLRELRGAVAPENSPKTFGTIPNSHVRRRQRKGQAPVATAAASAPAATPSSVFAKASKPVAEDAPGPNSIWNKVKAAKDDTKPSAASSKPAAESATPEPKDTKKPIAAATSSAAAPPALKRAGSSGGGGIMQAFAKGASVAKPKKKEPAPVVKKPAEEDTSMAMSDDGGDDGNDEDVIPKAQQVVGGKSRQERQEELRKMMEEDDDDDAEDEKDEDEREDTPMEDVEEDKPAEAETPAKDDGPSEVVTVSSGDGRRRGKRRVVHKKMIEDKDGYLVTIQEPGWESFSEDEAPPKAAPVSATPASSSAPKPKKPAPKTGQGSIMSFFGKNAATSRASPLLCYVSVERSDTSGRHFAVGGCCNVGRYFLAFLPFLFPFLLLSTIAISPRHRITPTLEIPRSTAVSNSGFVMASRFLASIALALFVQQSSGQIDQSVFELNACPDYTLYSTYPHRPLSLGPLALPFQRPHKRCRTFHSDAIETVISDVTSRMKDVDMARLFENAFPSTTDTTVKFHTNGTDDKVTAAARAKVKATAGGAHDDGKWEGAQSFVITGDIIAEWLRDSTNQLSPYQPLAKTDPGVYNLILGAINTQSEYVIESPYCNAFQPPPIAGLRPSHNGQDDKVHPAFEPSFVFECKYELDSLAHFLALANDFHDHTGSTDYLTTRWYRALATVLRVLEQQSLSTFDPVTSHYRRNEYTFQRQTNLGTETLNLAGIGNPLNNGTGLIRSAFRPSDDATILGFFIPANAMMAVELKRTAAVLAKIKGKEALAKAVAAWSQDITNGVWEHGVVKHREFGEVFAYEVDGYGSHILMDDANYPSLLALPLMGFVPATDPTYQNTRRMLLSKHSNPYYLKGRDFKGIGGPHIGLQNAWPMSLLIQAQTSDDDVEIKECLDLVLKSAPLGLIHESVDVNYISSYTRSWFAWANGVFAETILDLAKRKPHLIFKAPAKAYEI